MRFSKPGLPPALLDLTLSRIASGSSPLCRHTLHSGMVRAMHQAALASPQDAPPPYQYTSSPNSRSTQVSTPGRTKRRRVGTGSLAVRSGSGKRETKSFLSEFDRRVNAVIENVDEQAAVLDPPTYTEEDLLFLYEDLLAIPETNSGADAINEPSQSELDLKVLAAIETRLLATPDATTSVRKASSPLSDLLRKSVPTAPDPILQEHHISPSSPELPIYLRILDCTRQIFARLEEARSSFSQRAALPNASTTDPNAILQQPISIAILSHSECQALARVCIEAGNPEAAELTLDLMRRSGLPPDSDAVTKVMELYAVKGDVPQTEHLLAKFLTGPPTDRQRHLHVKAHLKATPPNTLPTTALATLHGYESQALPAPMKTYTSVITTLYSSPSTVSRAQAWDLYTHMRYVAHPTPDAALYTLMIRACASPLSFARSSEPERALDLWTEMTIDHRIKPTVGSYNAIILACARSGTKSYVSEGFRLAKEMLDAHRDARGQSAYLPDEKTFCALLDGAKRVGDLARTRWLLAEMVRGNEHAATEEEDGVAKVAINEEVMMHVFHAYASYRPPFRRMIAPLVDGEQKTSDNVSSSPTEETPGLPAEDTQPAFTHIPPQSRSEVIAEVRALFNRILHATGVRPDVDPQNVANDKSFQSVKFTSRLLNSYLSVYYRHSTLDIARSLFNTLFEELGVSRTSRSYMEALERCAVTRRGYERTLALQFAEDLWKEWQILEDSPLDASTSPISPRTIERAHIAFIRVLTLAGKIDRAVDHLKSFANRYPPDSIRKPPPKPTLRGTRTVLEAARPLVRMTSSVELPDDTVPPLIIFKDIDVLHHKLVASERGRHIGYLTYLCKAYEGALRARRDAAMIAEPPREKSKARA